MDKIKLFREGKEFPFLNATYLFDKYVITGTPRLNRTKHHALLKAKGLWIPLWTTKKAAPLWISRKQWNVTVFYKQNLTNLKWKTEYSYCFKAIQIISSMAQFRFSLSQDDTSFIIQLDFDMCVAFESVSGYRYK